MQRPASGLQQEHTDKINTMKGNSECFRIVTEAVTDLVKLRVVYPTPCEDFLLS